MTKSVELAMIPRDGIFCKDGRGWYTSEAGRGHSLHWPWPSTILGAMRSAWGWAHEDAIDRMLEWNEWPEVTANVVLGKTLTLRRQRFKEWKAEHRVWPVPLDALWLEEEEYVYRLLPTPSPVKTLGADDTEARELLWKPALKSMKKPLSSPKWWGEQAFIDWLCGEKSLANGEKFALTRRLQCHVGINPETLAADEGALYCHDVIETAQSDAEWALGIQVQAPENANFISTKVSTMGGDGRIMSLEVLPADIFEVPEKLLLAFDGSKGLRLHLITPAMFSQGWLPDGFENKAGEYCGNLPGVEGLLVLRSAYVARPVHVSGWDVAIGKPKPSHRMVAPGAVYFFEKRDSTAFSASEAKALWLAAIGSRVNEGFGRVVPGVWAPLGDK